MVLVANDDKHGPMPCFDTIFNENSDSLIHLLPHFSAMKFTLSTELNNNRVYKLQTNSISKF